MGRTFCVVVLVIVSILSIEVVDGKTVASANQTENQKGPTEQICKTPNGADGICININSCKSLKYIFEHGPRPFLKKVVDQLKAYICGFEDTVAKVCCPSDNFYLDEPDSKHPHIGFLNQGCGRRELFDYPWIALLSYRTNTGLAFKCQGTILTDSYILTTAHCANATHPLLGVRVGESNVNTAIHRQTTKTNESVCLTHQDLRIEKVILHHNYSRVFVESNIALLRVDRMDINVDETTVASTNLIQQRRLEPLLCYGETCSNINSCKSLRYILKSSAQPLSEQVVDRLKSHICGFEGTVPEVCCPINYDYSYIDEPDLVPIDVSKHPNIGLLNEDCGETESFVYPWIALFGFQTNKVFNVTCYGTVLNARYILTTALCAYAVKERNLEENDRIYVRVGERNLDTDIDCTRTEGNKSLCVTHQNLRIEKVILHDRFVGEFLKNDIGLIRVKKINITDNVKPICLPTGNLTVDNLMKERFTAVGFGDTGTALNLTGRPSPILVQIKLPLVPLNICREVYKRWLPIDKTKICAGGEKDKDVCDDTGGPLQYLTSIGSSQRYVQYGITSYGYCALFERLPSTFTKVENYVNWILDQMEL